MTLSVVSIAQVVINEVMHKPGPNNNTNQGIRRKEYVEIYNKGCSPVDIGCWVVGSAGMGIQTVTNPSYIGAFQFAAGTIINPGQHLVVGGTESQNGTGYSPADIDYDVKQFLNTNTCDPNTNWLLPNGDGWIALYDDTGTPIDAVYWSFSSTAPNLATDDDYASNPCVPSACSGISSLRSARQIFANFPARITFTGSATSNDLTFSRVPDGGNWTRNVAPSIAGTNQCNSGQCSSAPSFQLSSTSTAPSCGASNGSINITAAPTSGGITYTYSWSPNVSSSASASNIAAGTYQITITSSTGCVKDTSITLTSGNAPTAIVVNNNDPTCGQSNGSINLGIVTGGNGPYTYSLNGAAYSSSLSYTNLASGTYTLSVKDNNGCIYNAPDIILNNGSGPSDILYTLTNAKCGLNNGAINITGTTGGNAPYTYSLNGGPLSSTTAYTNLSAGNYSIEVKDNGGCTFILSNLSLTVTPAITSIISIITNSTCSQANGAIDISSVLGGTQPFTYNFNNGNQFTAQTSYNGLTAGNYSITAQDANLCLYTVNVSVLNDNSVNGPQQLFTSLTPIECGASNGAIKIDSVTGGVSPYQYKFQNGAYASQTIFDNLPSGVYNISIKDSNSCVLDTIVVIPESFDASGIFIPNAFTPNSDAFNASWGIEANCAKSVEGYIYNRWGEKIADITDKGFRWDGKFKNREVPIDVYAYVLEITYLSDRKEKRSGVISLIR